jgi:Methyltransferase domain
MGTVAIRRHESTFRTLSETATDQRFNMPYQKTYPFLGDFINDWHQKLSDSVGASGMIDIGIEGWLLPADALKLYELGYFCGGDILELGTYRGLSTAVIGMAVAASESGGVVISVDLDPGATNIARENLKGRPGAEAIHLFAADAGESVRTLSDANRTFDFAFVDHSHQYAPVFEVCHSLHRVLNLGAFCLFHDFNDPRNAAKSNLDYSVYQGVMDGLKPDRFEFWGIFGCCGLFRRIGPC